MKRLLFVLVALAAVAAGGAAVTLLAGGSAGAADSTVPPKGHVVHVPFGGDVYRLTVAATVGGREAHATEWVAPTSRSWRIETENVTYISSPTRYVVRNEPGGTPYVRSGSPSFLGNLRELSFGLEPVRRYLGLDGSTAPRMRVSRPGGKVVLRVEGRMPRTITIERRLSAGEARRAQVFELRWASGRNEFREVPVGRRTGIGVRGYWLGPSVLDRSASIATEWVRTRSDAEIALGDPARSDMQVHTTHYLPPSARGRSSARPGADRPDGEIQVVTEPLSSAHAQFALEVFDGQNGDLAYDAWPRTTVQLRGGERATLIPDQAESSADARASFAVVTEGTLIFVVGSFTDEQMHALVRQLRPLD